MALSEFPNGGTTMLVSPTRPLVRFGQGGTAYPVSQCEGQPGQPDAHSPDAGGNRANQGAPGKRLEAPQQDAETLEVRGGGSGRGHSKNPQRETSGALGVSPSSKRPATFHKCPTCGCESWDYQTIYLRGGWKIRFRCGHFFQEFA